MHFLGDNQAQAIQVGAVLLFAIFIIAFSTYQAFIVPTQNKQVEFDHSRQMQRDMIDLRNEILTAKQTGARGFAEVTLGTRYPRRLIALNPPPVTGSLRTGPREDITVEADGTVPDLCPSDGDIETRNLTYAGAYAEYQNAPEIVYENTVMYLRYDDETVLLTDEQLVQGAGINLVPLNTSYGTHAVDSVSVEPIPGNIKTKELDNANVSLPTGLSEAKWESLLSEDDIAEENITVRNNRLELNTTGTMAVTCSPIGLNKAPPGGQRAGGGVTINPAGPNDVEIRSFSRPSNDVVEVTFNNTGNTDANVTEARIAFYNNQHDQGGDVGPIDLIDQHGNTVLSMEILGPRKPLDPEIEFPGNFTETTIRFENTGGEKLAKEDFVVVQLVYSNGKEGTYFIDVPS